MGEITNTNIAVNTIKSGKTIIHVKSIFEGKNNLADVLFALAKEQIRFMENTPAVCYTDCNGSKNQYQDCAVS